MSQVGRLRKFGKTDGNVPLKLSGRVMPRCLHGYEYENAKDDGVIKLSPQVVATHPLDAVAVAAENHPLLMENDKVRVLDTKVEPGQRTPVHAHEWGAALYVLSWSDFLRYDTQGNELFDSRTMQHKPPPGSAFWAEPIGPHYVQNIGDRVLHIVAVEIKAA
jgi:hypothetical protein